MVLVRRFSEIAASPANFTGGDFLVGVRGGTTDVRYSSSQVSQGITALYNVKNYGAVGDGVTNDTAAVQAALNDSWFNNPLSPAIFFPGGTYKVHKLNWFGNNLIGQGAQVSILKGFPGEDILYVPDLSAGESNAGPFPQSVTVQGLKFVVDNSIPLTLGPGGNFNRPVYPVIGTWSAGHAVLQGQFYQNGVGKIYQAINSGTTGASQPVHTNPTFRVSDGTVTWEWIANAQRFIGNACIAIPAQNANNNNTEQGPINGTWTDLWFTNTNGGAQNSSCGIYSARGFYNYVFNLVDFKQMDYGFCVLPGANNVATATTFAPDLNTFINVTCSQCLTSVITYNFDGATFINYQFYGESTTPCQDLLWYVFASSGRSDSANCTWISNHAEVVGADSIGAYEFTRIQGTRHTFYGGTIIAGGHAGFVTWSADFSYALNTYCNTNQFTFVGIANSLERMGIGGALNVIDAGSWNSFQVARQDYASDTPKMREWRTDGDNTGSPNGVVFGSIGDIFSNRAGGAGTTLWVKESGNNTNTGWVGK